MDDWVPYSSREDWKDINPLPQNDGPNPVVKILYKPKFTEVYDYMRAIMAKREMSERALAITGDAIEQNPANYTVWHYRRLVLQAIGSDLKEELCFCQEMIEYNPKNYQVWHHRRVVVGWLSDPSKEKSLTRRMFGYDSKNYHCWDYRQWIIQHYGLFDGEMEFTSSMIHEDIRNNSAWNHRFFILTHSTGLTQAVVEEQTKFTLEHIQSVPANESPWSFLLGLMKKAEDDVSNIIEDVIVWIWNMIRCTLIDKSEALKGKLGEEIMNPLGEQDALELLACIEDGWVESLVLSGLLDFLRLKSPNVSSEIGKKICSILAVQDSIRFRYWQRLSQTL